MRGRPAFSPTLESDLLYQRTREGGIVMHCRPLSPRLSDGRAFAKTGFGSSVPASEEWGVCENDAPNQTKAAGTRARPPRPRFGDGRLFRQHRNRILCSNKRGKGSLTSVCEKTPEMNQRRLLCVAAPCAQCERPFVANTGIGSSVPTNEETEHRCLRRGTPKMKQGQLS